MKMHGKWLFPFLASVLMACSSDDGDAGFDSLIDQTTLNAGHSVCVKGGLQIDSGLDSNRDGVLAEDEVTNTQYLCQDGNFELQLLHFADVDGGRDIINNATRFSALLNNFRSAYPNTLVLSSGDNWIPGPEYNVASDSSFGAVLGVPANGRAHVAYLNALGVQASAFGNHEFDLGTDDVADILAAESDGGNRWEGAQFPCLAANLDFFTDSSLAPLVGNNGAEASTMSNRIAGRTVITLDGEPIGIVGATTPTLASISSPGDVGFYRSRLPTQHC